MFTRKGITSALAALAFLGGGMAIVSQPQASASPWSEGCLTWHDKDGSCVGSRELREEQRGMNCGYQAFGGKFGPFGAALNPDFRHDCIDIYTDDDAWNEIYKDPLPFQGK